MFSFLGTTIGFLKPFLLVGVPLSLAFLLYVYLRKGKNNHVLVGTILLLKKLQRTVPARRKISFPLRFFFELLLFSFLCLAAAGIYNDTKSSMIAVLIDNSLSMGALDPGNPNEENLLAVAKRDALSFATSLKAGTKIEVFSTSPRLSSLTAGLVSIGEAKNLIDKVSLKYAEDLIQSSIQQATNKYNYDQVVVFTDRNIERSYENGSESKKLVIRRVGHDYPTRTMGNVAITDLAVQKPISTTDRARVTATAANFGAAPVPVIIKSKKAILNGGSIALEDGASLAATIPGNSTGAFTFILDPLIKAYQFDIEIDRAKSVSVSTAEVNALPLDDSGWLSTEQSEREVVVITPYESKSLGLDRVNFIKFRTIAPSSLNDEFINELSEKTPIIFHNSAPITLLKAPTLVINPPKSSSLIEVKDPVAFATATKWEESHPIVSYLNVPLASFKNLSPLGPSGWASPIIETDRGPAVVAGTVNNTRVVIVGFEIFPFEGRDSPFSSILFLNIMKWLTDSSLGNQYSTTFSPIQLDDEISSVLTLDGKPLKLAQGKTRFVTPSEPGLYLLKSASAANIVAVNFFSRSESDTFSEQTIRMESPPAIELKSSTLGNGSLVDSLLWLSIFLLAADLTLNLIRRLSRRSIA